MTVSTSNQVAKHRQRIAMRFSLRWACFAMAVTAIVFAAVHYGLRAHAWAKRTETTNDLRSIAHALRMYSETNNCLPSPIRYANRLDTVIGSQEDLTAEQLCSWRFAIIPYLAHYHLEVPFGQRWDSPACAPWRTIPQPFAYDGWGDGAFDKRTPSSVPNVTRVVAITGPGTAFGYGRVEAPASLDDIDVDTVLLVEIRDSGLHWMEPGDFDIRTMPRSINSANGRGISSVHKTGFHVVFADGTVWFLRNDVPFDQLSLFFTIAGARRSDRDIVLRPYLHD